MSPGTVLELGIIVVTSHESRSWGSDSLTVNWLLLSVGSDQRKSEAMDAPFPTALEADTAVYLAGRKNTAKSLDEFLLDFLPALVGGSP